MANFGDSGKDGARLFAFVRQLKGAGGSNLRFVAQIDAAGRHARREDRTSQARLRHGADPAKNYFWSKVGSGLSGGGADYLAAFRMHKKQTGTGERKGAALAAHALIGVSPEWLAEVGDVHDPCNPRIIQLREQARKWVESWAGLDAVWAVRVDLDEAGAGVVDVIYSPVRPQKHKSGKSKPVISVAKAAAELLDQVNADGLAAHLAAGGAEADFKPLTKSYAAMQSSWAAWAAANLDTRLERGDPAEKTTAKHINPTAFKALAEERARILADAQADAERIRKAARRSMDEVRTRADAEAARAALEAEKTREARQTRLEAEKATSEALRAAQEAGAALTATQEQVNEAKADLARAAAQRDAVLAEASGLAAEVGRLKASIKDLARLAADWLAFKSTGPAGRRSEARSRAEFEMAERAISAESIARAAKILEEEQTPSFDGRGIELPPNRDGSTINPRKPNAVMRDLVAAAIFSPDFEDDFDDLRNEVAAARANRDPRRPLRDTTGEGLYLSVSAALSTSSMHGDKSLTRRLIEHAAAGRAELLDRLTAEHEANLPADWNLSPLAALLIRLPDHIRSGVERVLGRGFTAEPSKRLVERPDAPAVGHPTRKGGPGL